MGTSTIGQPTSPAVPHKALRKQRAHKTEVLTLPDFNIAPENRPLEKENPIGNHHFQVLC